MKKGANPRDSEVDSKDMHLMAKTRALRTADAGRAALAALALLMSLTVLAVSANALAVYQRTHAAPAFMLPLWPFVDKLYILM